MEATISFDLVSPEQLVFNDKAGMIIVPGKEGDIGVLPGHSKLLSSLRSGRVMVYGEGKQLLKSFFVFGIIGLISHLQLFDDKVQHHYHRER